MTKLNKRIYYGFQVSLETPLCISNGIGEVTDRDVLRNWEDIPFIPGTSLAGAFRSFIEECGDKANELFGSSDDEKGKMSQLWISDFYFDTDVSTAIRDGVHLEEKISVSGAKYDYEVVEYGSGVIYMQLQIWDGSDEETLKNMMQKIAGGIQNGDIRLGSQKNRGLGKLRLENIYVKEFTSAQVDSWIDFEKEDLSNNANKVVLDAWCMPSTRFVTLQVPLALTGGLSIRQYSTKVNEPDFISLMKKVDCQKEQPVIPGSSWKGALRQRMMEIIDELGLAQALATECSELFGYVKAGTGDAKASEVVVSESILNDSHYISTVRNQVSRFENATVQGALFEEKCAVEGNTVLEVKVNSRNNVDWFIGVILLAIKDLQKGFLSIGGGAAIGRGLFADAGKVIISTGKSEKEYVEALKTKAKEVATI